MNILNATKLEFDVLVEILIFITFASGSVGHRVYLKENGWILQWLRYDVVDTYSWSRIHNVHELGIGIGLNYTIQELLIFDATCAESRKRLTAPAQGRLGNAQIDKKKEKSNYICPF